VNADNIAAGISPFNPDNVAIEAGRIMLHRITELLATGVDFAIETTLATRSYVSLVHRARRMGFNVSLIYIWLNSPELALQRVAERVEKGGHNIPENVVKRRYYKGAHNLFHLFMPICDTWIVADNSLGYLNPIARKESEFDNIIENHDLWHAIKKLS
jgi:predicted ABC-type ATPase